MIDTHWPASRLPTCWASNLQLGHGTILPSFPTESWLARFSKLATVDNLRVAPQFQINPNSNAFRCVQTSLLSFMDKESKISFHRLSAEMNGFRWRHQVCVQTGSSFALETAVFSGSNAMEIRRIVPCNSLPLGFSMTNQPSQALFTS